jgi:cyclase
MRFSISSSILAVILVVGAMTAGAQGDLKVTAVAGAIHMLEGKGGNIGVSAGEDGLLIVDDQFASEEQKIRAALKGINPGPLKFVLNTHIHGDHTGGNEAFGGEATIIAHENVRSRLKDDEQPKVALPVVTYENSVSVHFNGEEIELIHFPSGHTDTDTVVFFRGSNVVHMGDHFFSGRFPFIDLGRNGSVAGYLKNVGAVLVDLPDDVKIIPGHGPLSSKADLKAFHTMIDTCYNAVKEQVAAGKSIEDIQKQGVPAAYKDWGWRFISEQRWITTLHADLTK